MEIKREKKEKGRWAMAPSKLNPNIKLTPGSVILVIQSNIAIH